MAKDKCTKLIRINFPTMSAFSFQFPFSEHTYTQIKTEINEISQTFANSTARILRKLLCFAKLRELVKPDRGFTLEQTELPESKFQSLGISRITCFFVKITYFLQILLAVC